MHEFPCWAYGPDGEAEIFEAAGDIPAGWVDHPLKVKPKRAKTAKEEPAEAQEQEF